jgi:hypothetical protein
MTHVLLGPQRAQPTVTRALADLGVAGPVALVAAGWQERESDPSVIPELGVPSVNLALHARAESLFEQAQPFAEAYKRRQTRLKQMQDFYRLRLEHAEQAARAIAVRQVDGALRDEELGVSLDLQRRLDQDHLDRCRAVHAEFQARWPPAADDPLARQKRELQALIEPTRALVIAGGHVAVLLNRLRLFDVLALAGGRPVLAWSAGAMALTEWIVLFHDHPPVGEGMVEILDAGLGAVPGVVALPNPRLRLRLDDPERVQLLSQRFAPAACVAMDQEAVIVVEAGTLRARGCQRLGTDGTLDGSFGGGAKTAEPRARP